jgi:GT2 family glycosyltransferase
VVKYPLSHFEHIESEGNVGIAEGNNVGVRKCISEKTPYTLLLNNDIEFENIDLFKILVETAVTKKEPIITTKILFYDTRKIWMAGGQMLKYRAVTEHVGENKENSLEYNTPNHFNYAPTCFMLLETRLFSELGLFDAQYFVYYDDTDFVYRAFKAGYRVYYLPELEILHKVSSSTGGKLSKFSVQMGNRNKILFIRKHYSFLEKAIACLVIYSLLIPKFILNYRSWELIKTAISANVDGWRLKLN